MRRAQKKYDRVKRKLDRKGNKASNRLIKKYQKRKESLANEKRDVKAVKSDIKRNQDTSNKIIRAALKSGFNVSTKQTTKLSDERKRLAYALFFGSKGATYSQLKYGNTTINTSRSKVTKTKDGERAKHTTEKKNGVGKSYAKIAATATYSDVVRAYNRSQRKKRK